MATFTKTIPDDLVAEVIEAYCAAFKYTTARLSESESKADFAKRMDRQFTVNLLKKYRIDALETQRKTAEQQAETDCENVSVS